MNLTKSLEEKEPKPVKFTLRLQYLRSLNLKKAATSSGYKWPLFRKALKNGAGSSVVSFKIEVT